MKTAIVEIVIIMADKGDEPWVVQGEAVFEGDVTCPFHAEFYHEDGEFDSLIVEDSPSGVDNRLLRKMIIQAAEEFDD